MIPPAGQPRQNLNTLQLGRGLAAVAVGAFHMGVIVPANSSVLSRLSQHGNAGVDFFFVLSGFIMMHAHSKDASNPAFLKIFSGNVSSEYIRYIGYHSLNRRDGAAIPSVYAHHDSELAIILDRMPDPGPVECLWDADSGLVDPVLRDRVLSAVLALNNQQAVGTRHLQLLGTDPGSSEPIGPDRKPRGSLDVSAVHEFPVRN